jgi:repressor LexA
VHKTQEVRNGQVVVARLDEDVTVKRFQRKGSQVWLLPENEELSPSRWISPVSTSPSRAWRSA